MSEQPRQVCGGFLLAGARLMFKCAVVPSRWRSPVTFLCTSQAPRSSPVSCLQLSEQFLFFQNPQGLSCMREALGKGSSFLLSFFFWFVFFKRLKASCHVSQQHMKGSAYFPHTVAPSLRPQECKVLESKHQWITVGTLQMAGLHRLPRKSEHSLPNRSCVSHSPRRLGGSCFSPSRLQMFPQESNERREGPETQVTSMSACEREVGVQAGARARPPQPCLKGVRLRGAGHAAL